MCIRDRSAGDPLGWDEAALRPGLRTGHAGPVPARVHPRHSLQLASVARAHLVGLAERTNLLPGIGQQAYVDIDSLLRPVFGHAKQGASFGHTKIAGKQVLRKGLSPLATTISTPHSAPVLAGI